MPWTKVHFFTFIPCLVIYLLFSIWLGLKLQNQRDSIKLIPIHIISCILIILEIIKQIKTIQSGYTLNMLPLYFCSLFLFLFPLASLCKNKLKNTIRKLLLLSGAMVTGVMLIAPNIIYRSGALLDMFEDFTCFHTVVYHNLVVLGTCLMLTLNLVNFDKPQYKLIFIFYFTGCFITAIFATILNENYNNFVTSGIPFVETARQWLVSSIGFAGQIIYISFIITMTISFGYIMYYVIRRLDKAWQKFLQKRANKLESITA